MQVYTAVMRQLQQDRACDWAQTRLMTIGKSCRAIARETLRKTLAWAVDRTQQESYSAPTSVDVVVGEFL